MLNVSRRGCKGQKGSKSGYSAQGDCASSVGSASFPSKRTCIGGARVRSALGELNQGNCWRRSWTEVGEKWNEIIGVHIVEQRYIKLFPNAVFDNGGSDSISQRRNGAKKGLSCTQRACDEKGCEWERRVLEWVLSQKWGGYMGNAARFNFVGHTPNTDSSLEMMKRKKWVQVTWNYTKAPGKIYWSKRNHRNDSITKKRVDGQQAYKIGKIQEGVTLDTRQREWDKKYNVEWNWVWVESI